MLALVGLLARGMRTGYAMHTAAVSFCAEANTLESLHELTVVSWLIGKRPQCVYYPHVSTASQCVTARTSIVEELRGWAPLRNCVLL